MTTAEYCMAGLLTYPHATFHLVLPPRSLKMIAVCHVTARILVAMLLWKDYLLRNTLDGIFRHSVKVQVMILL